MDISQTIALWWTLLILSVTSIPIDNGVIGEPEMECQAGKILINFNTRNEFHGRVYVKLQGLSQSGECVRRGDGRTTAGINLRFDSCNVRRTRSLNPRGIFVSTSVIISFHPRFETKVDRAYLLKCYYMESEKTVTTFVDASMLTTGIYTFNIPMPVCRYEILDGGPSGPIVEFAVVGQQVFHSWKCDTEQIDAYCMVVHSCMVDDSGGEKVLLIDPMGCAADIYLLNNIEYTSDLMAGVEAHIFKYADRAQLFFQCQIAIYVKELGMQCPRPNCEKPNSFVRPGDSQVEENSVPFPPPPGSPYLPKPIPISRYVGNLRDGVGERLSEIPNFKSAPAFPDEVFLLPENQQPSLRPKRMTPPHFAGITDVQTQITAVNVDERKEKDLTLKLVRNKEDTYCFPKPLTNNIVIGVGLGLCFICGLIFSAIVGKRCRNANTLRLKT